MVTLADSGSEGEIGEVALLHQLFDRNLGGPALLREGAPWRDAEREAGAGEKCAASDHGAAVEIEAEPALANPS